MRKSLFDIMSDPKPKQLLLFDTVDIFASFYQEKTPLQLIYENIIPKQKSIPYKLSLHEPVQLNLPSFPQLPQQLYLFG